MNPETNRKTIEGRTLDRWPYFWRGCTLMAIKYNLDRAVAWFGFNRPWHFWNYIKPHGFAGIDAVPPDDQSFYVVLLLTSLPFFDSGHRLDPAETSFSGASVGTVPAFFRTGY
jgi:hypothetical protein